MWPQGAQLSAGRVNRDSIELSWTPAIDSVGVVGYRIETDTGLSWSTAMTFVTADLLEAETQYNFSIIALDREQCQSDTLTVR